jgi:ABC-type multidrug transport system ATPase subunit/ABC-type multidrug transport system permease subunit
VVVRAAGVVQEIGGRRLLHDVSFTLGRGELVGVLGPSGAGKSLLTSLLVGAARPARGLLSLFGRAPAELPGRVGFVPQGDVVHATLTVREALVTTARLRAPHLLASPLLLEQRIAEVVARLGLGHRLGVRIGQLSGGERRRAALAVELLTDPDVLVCDEVTSGLDVAAERGVMERLAELARAGTTVVCVTHTLASIEACDRLLVLCGGRLVFDGSPAAARARFDVPDLADLYGRLGERTPEAWAEAWPGLPAGGADAEPPHRPGLPGPAGLHQLGPLIARQLRVTLREGRSLLLLLLQAPLIAFLIAFAYDVTTPVGKVEVGFKLVLSALWLGCISSCQELVKERAIYRRERLAGLSPHAYLTSKAVGVALLALVQAAALTAVVYALEPLAEPPTRVLAVLAGAALAGSGLGLLLSAAVGTRTAAVGVTPLVLVPQILFVGTLEPLEGVAAQLGRLMPSHWGNEAMRAVLLDGAPLPAGDLAVLGVFTTVFLLGAWSTVLFRDGAGGSLR